MCGRAACTLAPARILECTGAKEWRGPGWKLWQEKERAKERAKEEEAKNTEVKTEAKTEEVKTEVKTEVKEEVKEEVKSEEEEQELLLVKEEADGEESGGEESGAESGAEGGRGPWPAYAGSCNAPPTATLPVLLHADCGLVVQEMRWGLAAKGFSTCNARAETAETKRTFKGLLPGRRCVVLLEGFYEWQRSGPKRRAFYATSDAPLLALAGLYQAGKGGRHYCTVLTVAAPPDLLWLHTRMPALLRDEGEVEAWLRPGPAPMRLLRPPAAAMNFLRVVEVSSYVNAVKNRGERCRTPLADLSTAKGSLQSFFARSPQKKKPQTKVGAKAEPVAKSEAKTAPLSPRKIVGAKTATKRATAVGVSPLEAAFRRQSPRKAAACVDLTREACKYGSACYQTSADHRARFAHAQLPAKRPATTICSSPSSRSSTGVAPPKRRRS